MNSQDPFFRARRRAAISQHPTQIGLDYGVVESDQLRLYFVPPAPGVEKTHLPPDFNATNIRILGGTNQEQESIRIGGEIRPMEDGAALLVPLQYSEAALNTLFPSYRLELVDVPHLDPFFAQIEFTLQGDEPAQFDPKRTPPEPAKTLPVPEIDYLSRDFASFRQLMLDRLSVVVPQWTERNEADTGQVLVDVLAHVADQLSYYQDAVATEAYLGTARRRESVRRHARLLDYVMHDGCNARVWVQVQVNPTAVDRDVATNPSIKTESEVTSDLTLLTGTKILTGVKGERQVVLSRAAYQEALLSGAQVFETMHDVELYAGNNELRFYTWGARDLTLIAGATSATLDYAPHLKAGDVLILEELSALDASLLDEAGDGADGEASRTVGQATAAKVDGQLCHVVRLMEVFQREDALGALFDSDGGSVAKGAKVITEIIWHGEDALPFDLPVVNHQRTGPLSVARGNIVLADHGRTVEDAALQPARVPAHGNYRPHLRHRSVTRYVPYDHELAQEQSAAVTTRQDPRQALPAIELFSTTATAQTNTVWQAQRDLMQSDRFMSTFVVEADSNDQVNLRFGDGVRGQRPQPSASFQATYRVGNGLVGNIGRRALTHIAVLNDTRAMHYTRCIRHVSNYVVAQSGTDPESVAQVKLNAPAAAHTQERCVVEQDYVAMVKRHPEVDEAGSILRWTGSWYTAVVVVVRRDNRPVDAAFQAELLDFLESARVSGYDVVIRAPRYVALDIELIVQVAPTHFASTVLQALLETFSAVELSNGKRGYFHADNFTLGQPVYLSELIARAVEIPGVAWTKATRFQIWGRPARNELANGKIPIGPLEIAQLLNNAAAPQDGQIEFTMRGGR
ncbi:MAG: putative baseplate assembly protein [Cyanobacteria bacterium P01_D01_bin.44]